MGFVVVGGPEPKCGGGLMLLSCVPFTLILLHCGNNSQFNYPSFRSMPTTRSQTYRQAAKNITSTLNESLTLNSKKGLCIVCHIVSSPRFRRGYAWLYHPVPLSGLAALGHSSPPARHLKTMHFCCFTQQRNYLSCLSAEALGEFV